MIYSATKAENIIIIFDTLVFKRSLRYYTMVKIDEDTHYDSLNTYELELMIELSNDSTKLSHF